MTAPTSGFDPAIFQQQMQIMLAMQKQVSEMQQQINDQSKQMKEYEKQVDKPSVEQKINLLRIQLDDLRFQEVEANRELMSFKERYTQLQTSIQVITLAHEKIPKRPRPPLEKQESYLAEKVKLGEVTKQIARLEKEVIPRLKKRRVDLENQMGTLLKA